MAEFDIDLFHVSVVQVDVDFDQTHVVADDHGHEVDHHEDEMEDVVDMTRNVALFTTNRHIESMVHLKRPNGRLKLITYHHAAVGKI